MSKSLAEKLKDEIYRLVESEMNQATIPDLFYNWYVNLDSKIPRFDAYSTVALPAGYLTVIYPVTGDRETAIGAGRASGQLALTMPITLRVRVTRNVEDYANGDAVDELAGLASDAISKAEEDITRFFSDYIPTICQLGIVQFDYVGSTPFTEGSGSGDTCHPYFLDLKFNYIFYRQRGY